MPQPPYSRLPILTNDLHRYADTQLLKLARHADPRGLREHPSMAPPWEEPIKAHPFVTVMADATPKDKDDFAIFVSNIRK